MRLGLPWPGQVNRQDGLAHLGDAGAVGADELVRDALAVRAHLPPLQIEPARRRRVRPAVVLRSRMCVVRRERGDVCVCARAER